MKKIFIAFGLLALLSSCTPDPVCYTIEQKDQHLYQYYFTLDTGKKIEVHEVEYKHYNVGSDYCGQDYRTL